MLGRILRAVAAHDAPFRIGHGFDRHRLEALAPDGQGKSMVIGGVGFDASLGPIAHSDGDCLLHAITDALLGAAAMPDIGQQFPDSEARWQDADSRLMLSNAVEQLHQAGWVVSNLDATVVLDAPKIGPHKDAICAAIASILGVDTARVNIKGKTHERAAHDDSPHAIEAHAVVLLSRAESGDSDQ
jgi:2-C-methyl-D-erythritol 2,4-cyclodiphosphate synthase